MLNIDSLDAGIDGSQILKGLSLDGGVG